MRKKYTLAACALAMPLALLAVPADPTPLTVVNPDGTTLTIVNHGDENFNYYTDGDGYKLLDQGRDGYWRPVERAGRQLTAVASDIELLRQEVVKADPGFATRDPQRMAARDSNGRSVYPCTGEVHSLVVLVEFSDVPYSYGDGDHDKVREIYNKMLNSTGYSEFNGVGSAADYFHDVSDGQFKPIFDVTPVVTLPQTREYYVAEGLSVPSPGKTGRISEGWAYALNYLHEQGLVDFSKYDYDDDDVIDNVFFYYAGYGSADSAYKNTIWPHQANYADVLKQAAYYKDLTVEEVKLDGKTFNTYACANELKGSVAPAMQPWIDGIGTFCHEYTHVLGLPDLYDTSNSGTAVPGKMDIMCSGSYNRNSTQPPMFSAYEKWVCKWLEYTSLDEPGHYTIEHLGNSNKAYRVNIMTRGGTVYSKEYFIIEARGPEGWDESLPDHGILITHIRYNSSAWTTNNVNVNNDPRVELLRPTMSGSRYCWSQVYPHNYPGRDGCLKPVDYDSPSFSVFLTDMSYNISSNQGSFDYNLITELPEGTPTLYPAWRAEKYRDVYLKWSEVEGATDYSLTAFYYNNGTQVFVDGLNDIKKGLVTDYLLEDLMTTAWNSEWQVKVRAWKDFPCKDYSNTLVFTPSQLPTEDPTAGVMDVVEEQGWTATGLKGAVEAPEGARVYDLQGMQRDRQGLAPGLYFVTLGGKTVKVMVK